MGELSCLRASELNGACDDAATVPLGPRNDKSYSFLKACQP